jgi:hypothetical protein
MPKAPTNPRCVISASVSKNSDDLVVSLTINQLGLASLRGANGPALAKVLTDTKADPANHLGALLSLLNAINGTFEA